MKEIIKKIKEKDIDVFILITFIVTVLAFYRELSANDELWNFAYIYKMNLGYIPYKDLNIIVTPLFHIIGAIMLKIFGNNYFGFTIYNIVIYVTVFMLIFKLFKTLNIKKRKSIIYTLVIIIASETQIPGGANYNKLVLIPILATTIMLVKEKKNSYILGIMAFITFLIKQNIGIYFLIGIILYQLIEKAKIKEILKTILTFMLLVIAFIIFMFKKGILYNFINYAFLGINEFSINNLGGIWNAVIYIFVFIFIIALSIFVIKNRKINLDIKIKENIKMLLAIGTPLLLIAYPIFNHSHVLVSGTIIIIEFIYLIDSTLISELFTNRKKEKIISFIIILMYLIKLIIYIITYIQTIQTNEEYLITDKNNPYYSVLCSEEMKNEINNICSFIIESEKQGIDVKIISYKAQLYMVPLNKNNRNLDLPLLGNLGKEGEDGLIKQIKELKNTKILIQTNEDDIFWQESEEVRKYIQENYQKEGTIEDFDIYVKM